MPLINLFRQLEELTEQAPSESIEQQAEQLAKQALTVLNSYHRNIPQVTSALSVFLTENQKNDQRKDRPAFTIFKRLITAHFEKLDCSIDSDPANEILAHQIETISHEIYQLLCFFQSGTSEKIQEKIIHLNQHINALCQAFNLSPEQAQMKIKGNSPGTLPG